jgi:hypothetical protein
VYCQLSLHIKQALVAHAKNFSVPHQREKLFRSSIFVQWARSVAVREAETRGTGVNWRGLSAFHSPSCYPCGTRNAVFVVAFKIHHETKVIFQRYVERERKVCSSQGESTVPNSKRYQLYWMQYGTSSVSHLNTPYAPQLQSAYEYLIGQKVVPKVLLGASTNSCTTKAQQHIRTGQKMDWCDHPLG